MKILYTEEAVKSLNEALDFLDKDVPYEKRIEIRDLILDRADQLLLNPNLGQVEEYLLHLGLGHRRLICNHYKIVYRIKMDLIIITDIFDTRQDPGKMKA